MHVKGLEKCLFLTEVNLNNNDLADVHSIKPLAHLPYLARLDLSHNNFHKTDIKNIQAYFARVNPKCRVEFDNRKSGLISSWAGDAVSPTGGTTSAAVALEQRSGQA